MSGFYSTRFRDSFRLRRFAANGDLYVAPDTGSDPYFADVVALLHLEGTNGSTTITDVTGKAWTAFGNAQLSNTSAPFGATALALDGAGDYIELNTATADVAFGTGDFTIECFVYRDGISGTDYQTIIQPNSSYLTALECKGNLTSAFRWYENGEHCASNSGDAMTWYHVALARESGVARLFKDGIVSATTHADVVNYSATGKVRVGSPTAVFGDLWGRVKEVRVTKGVARYNANFAAPTGAFPDR